MDGMNDSYLSYHFQPLLHEQRVWLDLFSLNLPNFPYHIFLFVVTYWTLNE